MKSLGKFDSSLQMFVQQPHEINLQQLQFMRWLGEHGRLEHAIAGPSSGPLVDGHEALPIGPPPVALCWPDTTSAS